MNNMVNRCNRNCQCGGCSDSVDITNDPLLGMPIGIGYVPWQHWKKIYNVTDGLKRGTIFQSLDLPFYGCIPQNCRKYQNRGGAL